MADHTARSVAEIEAARRMRADANIKASYRYLRLSVVVLVITLAVSLLIEMTAGRTRWLGSISAYYWTPVHAVFIGALFAMGASFVALKGRDSIEDMSFNLAGVLAPVVALVPTRRPGGLCERCHPVEVDAAALVRNNVPALGIALFVTIVVAYVIARLDNRRRPSIPTAAWVGLGLGAALLVGGVVWYVAGRRSFHDHAHLTAAAAMFVAIWCAVMVNAGLPRRLLERLYGWLGEEIPEPSRPGFLLTYRILAVCMAVSPLILFSGRDHQIFVVEALEILPFGVFWALQTAEGWDTGFTAAPAAPGQPVAPVQPAAS